MAFLELSGLRKAFNGTVVVRDLNLAIEQGQLVCLLGPSGCGKTTTLRLVAGFLTPEAGEIRVAGRVISRKGMSLPPERRNMSMIFQSYALWPHLTVFENVAYGLRLRRRPEAEIRERVRAILDVTRLSSFPERYPGELSGGQQQRVSLARALVVKPEILLLDEPLSNLDANLREEMRFEIRSLHDQYRYTTVYVTHDQIEAMTTADLVVVMNQGVIEQAGTPEEIYERPRTEFVARFIGGTNLFRGAPAEGAIRTTGGLVLRYGESAVQASEAAAVSVRHHHVKLSANDPGGDTNKMPATVVRQTYLGSHRDYLVKLAGGDSVRAVTPVSFDIAAGQEVWVWFPPEHCRALA